MSRVFGWRTARPGGAPPDRSDRQARALAIGPGWRSTIVRRSGAEVGWVGAVEGRVAEDGPVAVVLDGRVHNRVELGFGESDAAGFLDLHRRLGFEGAMAAVNGDLVVVVHDDASDRLWLGRDRTGNKPAYWARTADGGIAVASQPRGLLVVNGVAATPSREYVALVAGSHYRTFDNRRSRSPYEAIAQLPAAHVLEAGPNGVHVRPYWCLEDAPEVVGDDVAEQYRALLADAVRLRLAGVRRPAFTLSGGMDSSSVIASAVDVTGERQHAFSSVYCDVTYDESDEIRSMLDAAVAEWHRVPVEEPDVLGLVERMVAVHDEPVATATWLSHWVLSKAVAEAGFDLLFGGLGGDELNAGEYEHFVFHFADLRAQGREADLDHEVERWAAHHDHPIWRKDRAVMEAELARRIDPAVPGRNRADLARIRRYAGALRRDFADLMTYEPVMDHPFRSHLKNRAYQDLYRETTPCCLRAEDRHAAAHGVEHADPFLDHRLVELLFRVPGDRKIRSGVTKRVLREAMRGVLPEETRTRVKKTGWNAPAHAWFAGDSAAPLADLIASSKFADRGIYDVAEVRRIFDEHQEIVSSGAAVENHMMFFWQLVNLEAWLCWLETTW